MAKETVDKPVHEHDSTCRISDEERVVMRCLECELLFESGISDGGISGRERCPQCGLQNATPVLDLDERAFVIRHSSPFR